MRRAELTRDIRRAAKALGLEIESWEGAEHEIWMVGGVKTQIPRHREISDGVTAKIRKQLEPVLGSNWWRT
jgi:hypothetical protein